MGRSKLPIIFDETGKPRNYEMVLKDIGVMVKASIDKLTDDLTLCIAHKL